MTRFIFVCDYGNLILAQRAAKFMVDRPQQKDAVVAYGEGKDQIHFYARRNKASITVRQDQ